MEMKLHLVDRLELGMEDADECYDPFWEYKWYCAADALDTDVINPVEDHLEGIVRDRVLFDVRNELMSEEDLWPHGLEP